jgi:enterochelin esterase family protein
VTDQLLQLAKERGNPVIEGYTAVFAWQGKARPPVLVGDFNDWETQAAVKLKKAAAGLWTASVELSRDAYIEYTFLRGKERLPDPLNPRSVSNGTGSRNQFFYMPEAAQTELTRRRKAVPHGEVTRHRVPTHDLAAYRERNVTLYRPYQSGPAPLLLVWDGQDYLRRGFLVNIVDNLIAEERIRPLNMALVDHGNRARVVEYACNEATLGFVLESVLPLARQHLDLVDPEASPGAYGVLGASMGGLMALFTGLRLPGIFGRVLSQSGAFRLSPEPFVTSELVRLSERLPLKIWMDVGCYEWLLEPNREMLALLQSKAYEVTYREYSGGHNYTAWRNDVWRGLETLFGVE